MRRGIGETLRAARVRRGMELPEVESALKIRARHLHAIEEEEWDSLPAGSYGVAFLRSYAAFLGLDGERIAAEHAGRPLAAARPATRVESRPPRAGRRRRIPRRAVTALVVLAAAAVLLTVGLATGGGGGSVAIAPGHAGGGRAGTNRGNERGAARDTSSAGASEIVLELETTAESWVCVLDQSGRRLVDGVVLPAGSKEGPFHSGSFRIGLGNGEVEMRIDGKDIPVPASSSPLGYAVDSSGRTTPLGEGERPTCL